MKSCTSEFIDIIFALYPEHCPPDTQESQNHFGLSSQTHTTPYSNNERGRLNIYIEHDWAYVKLTQIFQSLHSERNASNTEFSTKQFWAVTRCLLRLRQFLGSPSSHFLFQSSLKLRFPTSASSSILSTFFSPSSSYHVNWQRRRNQQAQCYCHQR